MKRILIGILFLSGCVSTGTKSRNPQSSGSPLVTEQVQIDGLPFKQRIGYVLEAPDQPFQGCIIYLEGLADSIVNHEPLFSSLSNAGFRVLAFDYPGQGGSEGSMNDTRVDALLSLPQSLTSILPDHRFEIRDQARWVWDRYSKNDDPVNHRDCALSKKFVIGWSTGGLAAYQMAHDKWADAVVLISPGIAVKTCVGEAAGSLGNCLKKAYEGMVIDEPSLTRNTFKDGNDPHIDPPKPNTPVNVPLFDASLVLTSYESWTWQIDANIKGLVFLSDADTFVNAPRIKWVLDKDAPYFQIIPFDGAHHELDNEIPAVADELRSRTVEFFKSAAAAH